MFYTIKILHNTGNAQRAKRSLAILAYAYAVRLALDISIPESDPCVGGV